MRRLRRLSRMEVVGKMLNKVHWDSVAGKVSWERPHLIKGMEGGNRRWRCPKAGKVCDLWDMERSPIWKRGNWDEEVRLRSLTALMMPWLQLSLHIVGMAGCVVTTEASACWVEMRWRRGSPTAEQEANLDRSVHTFLVHLVLLCLVFFCERFVSQWVLLTPHLLSLLELLLNIHSWQPSLWLTFQFMGWLWQVVLS